MAMRKVPSDFKEFLKLLQEKEVRYLLVGGYAVGYHGYVRATCDLDIWIETTPENADKVLKVLQDFGFDSSSVPLANLLKNDQIIRMGIAPVRIEIMTSIDGVNFDECFRAKIVDEIDGIQVNIISLNYLKINKKASGRYKDLDDLENLK